MSGSHLFAVDFGTCNSYFCRSPLDDPQPEAIQLLEGRDGLATVLLRREGREPLIGDTAIEEWGEATETERRAYDFRFNFKPDIDRDERARADAVDFFRQFAAQAARSRIDFRPAEAELIVGVPSEAEESFREVLRAVAAEAGYGEIELVDEPVGALMHHLRLGDIGAREAGSGTLVVDFGGGTCDFAYMERLKVRHSWGDMLLGGRLYDDLFYQIFIEQNSEAEEAIREKGDTFYFLWQDCRELKEKFSRAMVQDRGHLFSRMAGRGTYGGLRGLSWAEFRERAESYRPSSALLDYQGPLAESREWRERFADGPTDLFAWFDDSLAAGLEAHGIRSADVEHVILAGGSSLWPMVGDSLARQLGLEQSRIVRGNRPFAAIAEGLAALRPLQRRNEKARRTLRAGLKGFLAGVEKKIGDELALVAERSSRALLITLFDGRVQPILRDFKREGGSVRDLEERIEAAIASAEPELKAAIRGNLSEAADGLAHEIEGMLIGWFKDEGVTYIPRAAVSSHAGEPGAFSAAGVATQVSGFYEDIQHGVAVGVAALLVANLCGGSGLALVAAGLPGLFAGLIIAVLFGALAARHGGKLSWARAKEIHLHARLLKLILPDFILARQIDKGRAQFRRQVEEAMAAALAGPREELLARTEGDIRDEIDRLSALNQL